MKALLFVFVPVIGALTSIEAGANAKMTKSLGGPWWPAMLFSAISFAALAVVAVFRAGAFPTSQIAALPWWTWTGGIISAFYIVSMLVAPNVLGAGLFIGLNVTAAVIASILIDNWGLVGFEVHAAGWGRIIGAVLMTAGLLCVAVF